MNRSNSSGDQYLTFFDNFVLTRINQPLSAVAHSYAFGLFADFLLPVRRVLAVIAVAVFTASKRH
jgi:hypothetical protein